MCVFVSASWGAWVGQRSLPRRITLIVHSRSRCQQLDRCCLPPSCPAVRGLVGDQVLWQLQLHSYIELCRYVLYEWEGRWSQRPWEVKWQAERKIEGECHTRVCVLASPQWTLCVSPLNTLHFIIHNIRWSQQSRASTGLPPYDCPLKTGMLKLFPAGRPKQKLNGWPQVKSKHMEERFHQIKRKSMKTEKVTLMKKKVPIGSHNNSFILQIRL